MEELILTLSVIKVYNVSVGAVGGVGLTERRTLGSVPPQRNSSSTTATDKKDSEVDDHSGAM